MARKQEIQGKSREKDDGKKSSLVSDNISGILGVVVLVMVLFLFLFGIFSDRYRIVAVAIPVGIATTAFLVFLIYLSWEYAKKQL